MPCGYTWSIWIVTHSLKKQRPLRTRRVPLCNLQSICFIKKQGDNCLWSEKLRILLLNANSPSHTDHPSILKKRKFDYGSDSESNDSSWRCRSSSTGGLKQSKTKWTSNRLLERNTSPCSSKATKVSNSISNLENKLKTDSHNHPNQRSLSDKNKNSELNITIISDHVLPQLKKVLPQKQKPQKQKWQVHLQESHFWLLMM